MLFAHINYAVLIFSNSDIEVTLLVELGIATNKVHNCVAFRYEILNKLNPVYKVFLLEDVHVMNVKDTQF